MIYRHILLAILTMFAAASSRAQVVFHDEANDTVNINNMLIAVSQSRPATAGDALVAFSQYFIDKPYVAHTLEGDTEALRVNIDELDCTTLVETLMALAMTVSEGRSSWRDFTYNLQRLRYRGGSVKGYPSRLHYIADWAVDNIYRGNFTDVTTHFPRYNYVVKTINFMSANADKYTALADSANLAGIKDVEIGYRGHRYPYIKSIDLGNRDVKSAFVDGDILAFTSTIKNLDVTHMGVVIMVDGEPHVLHASLSAGRVLLSDLPIDRFVKRNKQFTGVRVFRLKDSHGY